MTTTTSIYIRGVPKEVKTRFKACCARNQVTEKDAILDLMRLAIKKGSVNGRRTRVR